VILPDVNVLVYAHREDTVDHTLYRQWLERILLSGQPYAISDHVLSGFLRIRLIRKYLCHRVRFARRSISHARFASSLIAALLRPVPATGKSSSTYANHSLPQAI